MIFGVGLVFPPRNFRIGEKTPQVIPAACYDGTHDFSSSARYSGQPSDPRAAKEIEQHGLDNVLGVVCGGHEGQSFPLEKLEKKFVSRPSPRHLRRLATETVFQDVQASDETGDAYFCAIQGYELSVRERSVSSQAVFQVGGLYFAWVKTLQ
jgi:hypothetical protein